MVRNLSEIIWKLYKNSILQISANCSQSYSVLTNRNAHHFVSCNHYSLRSKLCAESRINNVTSTLCIIIKTTTIWLKTMLSWWAITQSHWNLLFLGNRVKQILKTMTKWRPSLKIIIIKTLHLCFIKVATGSSLEDPASADLVSPGRNGKLILEIKGKNSLDISLLCSYLRPILTTSLEALKEKISEFFNLEKN